MHAGAWTRERMNRFHIDPDCERFVSDMLAHMTLLEKAGQLAIRQAPDPDNPEDSEAFGRALRAGRIGVVRGVADEAQAQALQQMAQEETRLGVPLLFVGRIGSGFETIFPAPATMAASFDTDALAQAGRTIAGEAAARGINWGLGPEIIPGGNPGDESEAFHAEHDRLSALLASAFIDGLQGKRDMDDAAILACLDFLQPSALAGGSPHDAAVALASEVIARSDIGALAFHRLGEDTRTALAPLLARFTKPGGYDGILLAEWDALASEASYSLEGMANGSMPVDSLVEAVSTGRIAQNRFEDAVARVLRAKHRIGLFGQALSGRIAAPRGKQPMPAHNREVALDLARRCPVLLRNEPALLPLGIDSGEILLVGPAASDRHIALADRAGIASSIIDGLEQLGVPHRYVPGLALRNNGTPLDRMIDADRMAIGMACEAAKRAGTVVVVLPSGTTGALGEAQEQLLTSLTRANPQTVLVTLGATAIDPVIGDERLPAVLHGGELGVMGGHAIAEILTAEVNPSGKLAHSLPAIGDRPGLPFGHGETYADFALTDLSLNRDHGHIHVSASLRNVGPREGTETIQLYVRHRDRKSNSPRLVAIQRVGLRPGEQEYLNFELGRDDIGRLVSGAGYEVATGEYEVFLGTGMARSIGEIVEIDEKFARELGMGTGSGIPTSGGRRSA